MTEVRVNVKAREAIRWQRWILSGERDTGENSVVFQFSPCMNQFIHVCSVIISSADTVWEKQGTHQHHLITRQSGSHSKFSCSSLHNFLLFQLGQVSRLKKLTHSCIVRNHKSKSKAMGCMGSKPKAGADVAVYRPPPTSVSLFDISAVEEPWLIAKNKKDGDEETEEDDEETTDDEKKPIVNTTVALLDKLEGYELAPASWSEVSKALEDMKPALEHTKPSAPKKKKKTKKKKQEKTAAAAQQPAPSVEGAAADIKEEEEEEEIKEKPPPPELAGRRIVKDNPFLMRDRENKDGAPPKWRRRDPFEGCPERRPPGASGGGVVLYTTTLRGVRRTFEDCERARELVEACTEAAGVPAVDERDVSLHGAYLRELRELVPGGEAAPPRLFVMGRYVGGAEECAMLAESGKLREMMRWAKARGEACAAKDGRGCMGCGGARFVPCWECGGSCKVVVGDDVERCGKCNENGLMMCPICH